MPAFPTFRRKPGIFRRWPHAIVSARVCVCGWLLATLLVDAAVAAGLNPPSQTLPAAQLADLSLEQLREVTVSTVSRVDERLDRVAASVYVIRADDIQRSGATTLPELLRLAPTLTVARADGNQYAIGARGFNNVLSNKLLVLIDGRTVYTPLFSGVFWEAQDVMLEDIERVEVVTGTSTALWGSNAVTGLIHIITRSAAAAGTAGSLQAGNRGRSAALRWAGALDAGGNAHLRAYIKSYQRDTTHRADGSVVDDAANGVQAGWRADWAQGRDSVTLQGDAYQGSIDQPPTRRRIAGANMSVHWRRDGGPVQTSAQLVVDHTERTQPVDFSDVMDIVDAVAQAAFIPADGHRLVVGGGLRHARDRTAATAALKFDPLQRNLIWRRLYAQDQLLLTPSLALTLSASVESNPYTGPQTLPSLRLAWTASAQGLLWGSLSRAVRAPSRVDREFFLPGQPPYVLVGGPNFGAEVSEVTELGWRDQPLPALSYAVTLYHARHHRLRSLAASAQGLQFENGIEGHSHGLEAWARWHPESGWRLDAGLTLLRQSLKVSAGAVDLGGLAALGNDPSHQAQLRSSLDLGAAWRWDLDLRRIGALPNPQVPAYTAVDSRLAWVPQRGVELTAGLENLFDPGHAEWGGAPGRAEFGRRFNLRLRLWH